MDQKQRDSEREQVLPAMKIDWSLCFRLGMSAFLLYLCIHYWDAAARVIGLALAASVPLLIGACIAYLVNLPMRWYERHLFGNAKGRAAQAMRRPVCLLLAVVSLLAVLTLVGWLVVPQLVQCVQLLLAKLPTAVQTVTTWLEEHQLMTAEVATWLETLDWKSKIDQLTRIITTGVGNVMGTVIGAVSSVFSGIVTAFLAIVFALYLLAGKERIAAQFRRVMQRYLSARADARIMHVLTVVDDSFHRYIVGQCTEAVILGALCALGMTVLRIPYATMIGALIAVTALIPIAGAYIGAGVGAFMILTVSPIQALIFIVFLVVLQQIEGNLIYPRVVGSSVGLPGIWVLAAVTVGGGVLGIGGMLLAVPLAAALWRLLREDVIRGARKARMQE